jgi:hypothetical protein
MLKENTKSNLEDDKCFLKNFYLQFAGVCFQVDQTVKKGPN